MARSFVEEASYGTKWLTTFLVGKGALGQVEQASSGPLVNALQGIGVGTSGSLLGFVVLPLVVGLSGGLAQMEHQHRRNNLREEYREEIAARLGKRTQDVTDADLDVVAKGDEKRAIAGNEGLKTSLDHSRKERNNILMLSVISTFVAMAATKFVMESVIEGALGGVGALGVRMAVGVATYFAVKKPLHWLASAINGLEEPSVADKAAHIARDRELGVAISQERVLDVYLEANPSLAGRIKEDYGTDFAKLNRHLRAAAVQEYGPLINLHQMTQDINNDVVRATEIAFDSYGQSSGVQPRTRPVEHSTPSMMERIAQFCSDTFHGHFGRKKCETALKEATDPAPVLEPMTPIEKLEEDAKAQISFVDRVGRKAEAAITGTHVERLAMQKADTTPSLHLPG